MTLLELVVVIVVTGILFALGAVMLGRAFHSFALARDATNLGVQGRVALERIERELRAIRSPTAADVPTRLASDIQFVDTEGQTVRFYYDPGARQVLRSDGATAWPLADGVTGFTLEYLDRNAAVLGIPPTASQVYYITVRMDVTRGDYSQAYRVTLVPRRFR